MLTFIQKHHYTYSKHSLTELCFFISRILVCLFSDRCSSLSIFLSIQILSSQHISLQPQTWVRLHPPSPITSSPMAPRARYQEERQPRPAPALLAFSATGSTKTSSPSTAPSWPPWWWALWPTLFLRGQSVEKNDMKSFVVKDISTTGFCSSAIL